MNYEQPTTEFRQVKKPIREHVPGDGVRPGYYRITGYETTIQRMWLVFEGVSSDPKQHYMGACDGTMVNGVEGKPEWRDIPVVNSKDAK
jgi:hypothetical protein